MMPTVIWWRFEVHLIFCAFAFARLNAGSSMAARIAIMAMTTSNSMSVKPWCLRCIIFAIMVIPDDRTLTHSHGQCHCHIIRLRRTGDLKPVGARSGANHSGTVKESWWHEGLVALQQRPCFSGFEP